jgi:fatty acyl-CoA reductase
VPIEGDVTVQGMALTDESRELLKNVSVVLHSAASVRFDDNLRDAVILNTRGTLEVINFALTLQHLVTFVHISTTYCYPERAFTDEQVYPVMCDWRRTIELAEKLDLETLETFMSHYTGFMPNTYVFTKALAEKICESYQHQLPITIVRPSIVVGTEREPFGGWCDNYNGPVGLLTACGIGIMRTMHASWECVLNCVAVDVVAKTIIVAAWKSAVDNESALTSAQRWPFRVYNCASLHNMTLKLLVYDGQYAVRKFPFEKCVYMPGGGVTLCRFMNYFRVSGGN